MEKGICYGSFVMVHTTIVQRNACDNANITIISALKCHAEKKEKKNEYVE